MASTYRIVLNLTGNATKRVSKLADELERANKAAKSLQGSMRFGGAGGYGRSGASRFVGGSAGGYIRSIETTLSSSHGLGSVVKLAGNLNKVVGIATLAGSILRRGLGFTASTNAMIYTGGAKLVNMGANFLTSSQMSEGIRLLQRRQQARLGFGASYAKAQERADLLAASYGLDPSNVIASMNVLTGMRVGANKITMGQAERLTQVGGLIAQSSGLSFETVMVNIQQMMAQAVPSLRDVRQVLTHAPILGRYAIDEMERRGVTGVSAMDFLKNDKGALMSVFERFLAENPAVPAMRAQGIVRQARAVLYANLSENPAWLKVAQTFKSITEAVAPAFNKLLTVAANSSAIQGSVDRFISLLNSAPSILDRVAPKLDSIINKIARLAGLDVAGAESYSEAQNENRAAIRRWATANQDALGGLSVSEFMGLLPMDTSEYVSDITVPKDRVNTLYKTGKMSWTDAVHKGRTPRTYAKAFKYLLPSYTGYGSTLFTSDVGASTRVGFRLNESKLAALVSQSYNTEDKLNVLGGNGGNGEDISGYGADRKALVINFNQPLVEWTSTINTDDPNEIVNEVSNTLEDSVAKAIQIALLGATGKMSSRF